MPLLVDGHNLIGQIPGIKLSDTDDEGKLVMLLRRYSTAKRSRQVVVVFDHGVYGHPLKLDGYGITCHFARSPQDADTQLIKRLRALKRPRDWMLVTSDRQVARVAEERGVKVMSSQEFARQLLAAPARSAAAPAEKPDAQLSEAEIAEWMEIFRNRPDKK
jgi:predicted RNA-binding protein with PIN domain